MKLLNRYVLREHVGPLVFALSALTSLLLLNYIAKQFGNLVGKGLGATVILEFFALSIPFTVAMTLPMAVLVATLYAFSRLAAENEITAMKASGVSMVRVMVPVIIAAAMLSLTLVGFNDQILPRANHRLRTLQGDIARKKPTFGIREQVLNDVSPGRLVLRANKVDPINNRLKEVTIYNIGDPSRRQTIYADSGVMAAVNAKDLQLTLFSGYVQTVPKNEPTQLQRVFFNTDRVRVADVMNQLDRTTSDDWKSDREMSVCEMHQKVFAAENEVAVTEADIARLKRGEPATGSQVGVRARHRRDLGYYYCRALDRAKELKLPALVREAGAAQLPPAQAQDTARRPAQDTTKRDTTKRDTTKKAVQDTSRRPAQDTARKPAPQDTSRRPAQSPVPVPAGDTTRRLPPGQDTTRRAQDTSTVAPNFRLAPGQQTIQMPPVPQIPGAGAVPDTLRPLAPKNAVPVPATIVATPSYVPPSTPEGGAEQVKQLQRTINELSIEIHKKFALSATCIVFVLIGAPLALRFPRGGIGLTLGVSLGVFALYYIALIGGEDLGDRGIIPPFWAMWGANALFAAIGLVLLARMGREATTSRGGDLSELRDAVRGWLAALGVGRGKRAEPRGAEPRQEATA